MSYQLPASAERDQFIGFREWWRSTRNIFRKHRAVLRYNEQPTAILGGFMKSHEVITAYIEKETGQKIGVYLAKAEWPEVSGKGRFRFWLRWSLFSIPLMWKCLDSPRRSNLALLIRECADTALFMHWLRKTGIRHLYDFLPYEIDSNLIALCCRQRGIRVTKIPSSGPLATHNRIMLGDEVVFTTPYQQEEFEKYTSTIRIPTVLKWGPEKAYTYISLYRPTRPSTPPKSLAFYSHGSWLRLSEDHSADGLNIASAEHQLLCDLRSFIAAHPDFQLTVFVHPRERAKEKWDATVAHYETLLGRGNFQFGPMGTPTSSAFHYADIALAAFSTINYERLFCGYKTLIGNYDIPGFPHEGSQLRAICFDSYVKMEALIMRVSEISHDDFFHTFNLEGYRYDQFPGYAAGRN
ncbi:MAG: hypothetical protein JNM00_09880 [Flavobacteriales bacterium]|nr:hypothetical protein [Flavobacteriales bacterium]